MDVLGIDISKADFHCHLLSERESHKNFPNSPKGFGQLDHWLGNRKITRIHACMEATGAYWEPLASHLYARGHEVSVVNPARIKAFAQSRLLRTKTDSVDAALIAQFCKTQTPPPWSPPPPEVRRLQSLVRHLDHLKDVRAQQLIYAQTPDAPTIVTHSIRAVIANLEAEIDQIQRSIEEHFDNHPDLRKKRDLLASIPGIGNSTADLLLSEMPDIERFKSSKSATAYAGLTPRDRRSGTSLHGQPRLCKTGNWRVRKALYFPALVAIRFNPTLKTFAQRLTAAGKRKMVVVGAVMRKLLALAYAILRSGVPFEPCHA